MNNGHQQQSAQHQDRVEGRPAAWAIGVEAVDGFGERIKVEADQEQGGDKPILVQGASPPLLPFGKLI